MAPDPNAINATSTAPDLSGLSQPGAAVSNLTAGAPNLAPDLTQAPAIPSTEVGQPDLGTAVQGSMQPSLNAAQAAYQKASQIANQPLPPTGYNGPHARLLSMIQGLSLGISAFGESLATRGQKGGAGEVLAAEAQQHEQQLQERNMQMAQRNAAVQQQITLGQTNEAQAMNILRLASVPDELSKEHLGVEAGQLETIGQAQDIRTKALQDLISTGDLGAYQNTISKIGQVTGAPSAQFSPASTTGTQAGVPQGALASWKNATDAALSAYPNDPQIQSYAAALNNPNVAPMDLARAANGAKNRMAALDAATESRTRQGQLSETAPLGADRVDSINAGLLQRYQVLHPDAKALPAGLSLAADATPQDFNRIDKIMQQTESSEATKAQREQTIALREQTLKLSGMGPAQGNTALQGDAYLQSLPGDEKQLVQSIGTGKIAPDRMGYLLARDRSLFEEVSLAYPDFDSSKAQAYPVLYKDFTSGKSAQAINAGATAFQHLAELSRLNTPESVIPGTAARARYENQLNTVKSELAKFYSAADIPGREDLGKTLGSNLPWQRDAAIKQQAQAMGVKMDSYEQQWKNGAPSPKYEAPMPGLSPAAQQARATLDPDYARTLQTPTATAAPAAVPPGMIAVQIPGQPMGHIPQSALSQFQKDHPNATVIH